MLPVSTLATIAQRAWREQGATQVAAAIDARMDEVYWGCYREHGGEMQLVGSEAVLPPEQAVLPRAAGGDWFGAGTGWGYAERMPVAVQGCDAALLPHAEDLLRWPRLPGSAARHWRPIRPSRFTCATTSRRRKGSNDASRCQSHGRPLESPGL